MANPWDNDAPVTPAAGGNPWDNDAPVTAQQTFGGAAQAVTSGVNSGALDIAGLPVDTTHNITELGKAAAGSAYHAIASHETEQPGRTPGGLYHYVSAEGNEVYSKHPPPAGSKPATTTTGGDIPNWLQPASAETRANDVGSSEYFKNLARKYAPAGSIDTTEDTGFNRFLHGAAEGGTQAAIGGGPTGSVRAAAATFAGGAAGQVAQEAVGKVSNDPSLGAAANIIAGALGAHAAAPRSPKASRPAPPPESPGGITPEEIMNAPVPDQFKNLTEDAAPAAEGNAPIPAPERKQVTVDHAVKGNTHTLTTPDGGKLIAEMSPEQGALKVTSAEVPQEARGQGNGGAMLAKAADIAQQKGAPLHSDKQVSEPEQRRYEALKEQGYDVKENPNETNAAGEKVSKSELQPVYEVTPKPKLPVDLSGEKPFTMLSAEKSGLTPEQNAKRTQQLEGQLKAFGIKAMPAPGNYKGSTENSFAVDTSNPNVRNIVTQLAHTVHGQEAVMHVDAGGKATLAYADGRTEPVGTWGPITPQEAQGRDSWTRDANGQHYGTTPTTVQPKPTPKAPAPTAKPVSFAAPMREGDAGGAVPEAQQNQRRTTLAELGPFGLETRRQSAITGDTKEAGTDFQTAKLDNSAGKHLAGVISNERSALQGYADDLVDRSGGTRGMDQVDRQNRGRTMATPIESYEAHLEDMTRQHYAVATERAQGKPFQLDGVAHTLANEKAQFLGTTEGKQLLEGITVRAKELGLLGDNETFHPATVEQAESLRQYLNDSYTPRTGKLLARLKSSLDLDVAKAAGEDVYKDARAVRNLRAKVIEEPEGVQGLRKADDRLGINRPVALEDIPKHVASLSLQQLSHLVDVYHMAGKVNPEMARQSAAAINELRAHYANEIKAAGSDSNAPGGAWNVKNVHNYLQKNVGAMSLVHTPEEMQRYKTLNDAGTYLRMDRSYPGAAAQGHNLITRGALGALEHGATATGAVMGHIPGAIIGHVVGKGAKALDEGSLLRAARGRTEENAPPAEPKQSIMDKIGERLGGGQSDKERGAVGDLSKRAPRKEDPLMTIRHFSRDPNLKVIDPNMQGTGTAATVAERNRSTKVSSFYPEKMTKDQPEKLVTQNAPHQYTAQVPRARVYDAVNDPDNLRGRKSFDAYEGAIKKAGYMGYHVDNPDYPLMHGQVRLFEKVNATPTSAGPPPRGKYGRQRGSIGLDINYKPGPAPLPSELPEATKPGSPEDLKPHLLPDEEKQVRRANVGQRVVDAFHSLPPTHELAAAALAGQAKRGWYKDAAQAIHTVFGGDAPRFTTLLAAMSPQTSVQSNFHNALHTFIDWDNAGRPTNPEAIKNIIAKNVQSSPIEERTTQQLQKLAGKMGVDATGRAALVDKLQKFEQASPANAERIRRASILEAWENNSVRALTHPHPETVPMLSGPKVDSFTQNLRSNVNAVTLDAWMASFANLNPSKLGGSLTKSGPGKSATYVAYSAKVREAATMLSHMTGEAWTPAEVQETVWSWAKTAYEHADASEQAHDIPTLVKNKALTDELIRGTADFHNLFAEPGHRVTLASSRFAEGAGRLLATQGAGSVGHPATEASKAAARALEPHLMTAAHRLEGVRRERNGQLPASKPEDADFLNNW